MANLGIQQLGAVACPCGPLNTAHEQHYPPGDRQAQAIGAAAPLLPVVDAVHASTALAHVLVVHSTDVLPDVPSIDVPAELLQRQAEAPAAALPATGAGQVLRRLLKDKS